MKMALACALPFRPELLVLDEPFSGLDPLVRDEFMERLLQQAGEMTVLISSHELAEIDGVATHVAFIDEGKLLFEESMSELAGRFREVHVTMEREARPPSSPPSHWLDVKASGNVLMFIDTRFSDDALSERVESLVGAVRRIDAQPMALRSISRRWRAPRTKGGMHDLAYFQKRREAHVPLAALVAGLNCILPGILILNGLYVRPELTGLAIMLSFGGVLADVQLSCIGMLRACFRVLLEYTPTGVRNPGEPLGCPVMLHSY